MPTTIKVLWDAETQSVGLQFEQAEFRNWDFVVGVLNMAMDQAKAMRAMCQAANMQKASEIAMKEAQIRQMLRK